MLVFVHARGCAHGALQWVRGVPFHHLLELSLLAPCISFAPGLRAGTYASGAMASAASGFLGPLLTDALCPGDHAHLHATLRVLRASPIMLFSRYSTVLERRAARFPVVGPEVLPAIAGSQARAATQATGELRLAGEAYRMRSPGMFGLVVAFSFAAAAHSFFQLMSMCAALMQATCLGPSCTTMSTCCHWPSTQTQPWALWPLWRASATTFTSSIATLLSRPSRRRCFPSFLLMA